LPTVALGTGLTENFFLGHGSLPITWAPGSRHRLCREPTVGCRPRNVAINGGLSWRFLKSSLPTASSPGRRQRGDFNFFRNFCAESP
jgi:hypothetical protein